MTISEIKNLTRFLSSEDVENIKNEIKSKEAILKTDNMDEEEMTQALNTLFAILVIEKTLESEIEDIEQIRAELEQELLESYEIYDAYMIKYKKEEKKKKKRWLVDFLFLSDRINSKKEGISASQKTIAGLKNELNTLRQQTNNDNLKNAFSDPKGPLFERFCKTPHDCYNPMHRHNNNMELNHRLNNLRENRRQQENRRGREFDQTRRRPPRFRQEPRQRDSDRTVTVAFFDLNSTIRKDVDGRREDIVIQTQTQKHTR